jgi:hypothetical protein
VAWAPSFERSCCAQTAGQEVYDRASGAAPRRFKARPGPVPYLGGACGLVLAGFPASHACGLSRLTPSFSRKRREAGPDADLEREVARLIEAGVPEEQARVLASETRGDTGADGKPIPSRPLDFSPGFADPDGEKLREILRASPRARLVEPEPGQPSEVVLLSESALRALNSGRRRTAPTTTYWRDDDGLRPPCPPGRRRRPTRQGRLRGRGRAVPAPGFGKAAR